MESSAGTSSQRGVRVFVINDYPIFLEGLRRFFLLASWIELVGTAAMSAAAIEVIADTQPDVVILDPAHRHATLPVIIRELRVRVPGVRVIVLTMGLADREHEAAREGNALSHKWAVKAGADAFVAKENTAEDLLAAVRRCAKRA